MAPDSVISEKGDYLTSFLIQSAPYTIMELHIDDGALIRNTTHIQTPIQITWMSGFHVETASSVSILIKEVVNPSRKNLWQGSLFTSRPERQRISRVRESGKTFTFKFLPHRHHVSINKTVLGNIHLLDITWLQLVEASQGHHRASLEPPTLVGSVDHPT